MIANRTIKLPLRFEWSERETEACAEPFFFGPPLRRGKVTVGLRKVTPISRDFKNVVTLGSGKETVGLKKETLAPEKVTLGLSNLCLNVRTGSTDPPLPAHPQLLLLATHHIDIDQDSRALVKLECRLTV
jgi:hypothetical protein